VKPLRYATNGKLIPGPFGKVEKDDPEMEEPEVNTENGLAKAKKPLTRAEKAEAEDLKEHPEKMCESLKKSPKGEEVTKQEKVNDPAPMYEKPADLPRKKKPVKAKVPEEEQQQSLQLLRKLLKPRKNFPHLLQLLPLRISLQMLLLTPM